MIRHEWPLICSVHRMDPMSDLAFKLRRLKEKVKTWSKEETQKMKDKSALLENDINALLSSTPSAILSKEQQEKLLSLKKIYKRFWTMKYTLLNFKVGLLGLQRVMQTPSISML